MNMSDMTKKLYPVTGMHCAACAGNVDRKGNKKKGKKRRKSKDRKVNRKVKK